MIAKAIERPDGMNRLEAEYAIVLEAMLRAGRIKRWDYQPVKLRLADKTFYTPDFRVIANDDTQEMHETKGFMRDDANVKLKVAAEQHPYRFKLVRKVNKQWEVSEV